MKVWDYKSKDNDSLSKQVKKDASIVMTKPEMAKHLISLINHEEGEVWIEPARGDGAFYNNFPTNVIARYCEINEGSDFLKYEEEVDVVISNPPFVPHKLFWDFMVQSMKIARKNIYWLINLSSLNVFTPKRLVEMTNAGWFIQTFHIVNDKRWFGRYVFLKIGRSDIGTITWNERSF